MSKHFAHAAKVLLALCGFNWSEDEAQQRSFMGKKALRICRGALEHCKVDLIDII